MPCSRIPKKTQGGFAKGGLCRHDFMKVCVERVQMRYGQGHRVSFWLLYRDAQGKVKR